VYLSFVLALRPAGARSQGFAARAIGQRVHASPIQRLQFLQERRNLEAELEGFEQSIDVAAYERAFIRVAKAYSRSKGITYATWRDIGVSAEILNRAGITRGRA
jgi:hypothetical protein